MSKTHSSYWAVVRDSDGFVPPGETASLVKITHRVACNWECDGINEDYAVAYGVCNVCGLPIVD